MAEPDLHVATVALAVDDGPIDQALRAKLFLHRGRFFSIEFPKRPDRLVQQRGVQLKELRAVEVRSLVALS
jgi:hypothetical protein